MDIKQSLINWLEENEKCKLEIPLTISLYTRKVKIPNSKEVKDYIILDVTNGHDGYTLGQRVENIDEVKDFLVRAINDTLHKYLG